MAKSFQIPKQVVMEAFKRVKANAGSSGIDRETIEDFERNLKDNLYKIWNRLSSGTYFPPPVRAVSIPKKSGGSRTLGIPTVADRVAQMVVKLTVEPQVERIFLSDSYGYRPGKSALDAVGITRQRCWRYNWVLEWDIKGLFDNISHELLMKAVRKHVSVEWAVMYIERWLTAPMQLADGTVLARDKGTPQGGVISPCLANLFMHYAFDAWLTRNFPSQPWCRYADDGLIHAQTEQQAHYLWCRLQERMSACGLELHPDKTKIVYCKDGKRKGNYVNTSFDFLGYTFRPRRSSSQSLNVVFTNFSPAISRTASKAMRQCIRKQNIRHRTDLSLREIASRCNPILRGWIEYYGKYRPSDLHAVFRHFNGTLVAWIIRKYRQYRQSKNQARHLLKRIMQRERKLFAHWQKGFVTIG